MVHHTSSKPISSITRLAAHNVAMFVEHSAMYREATNYRIDALLRPLKGLNLTDYMLAFCHEQDEETLAKESAIKRLSSNMRAAVGFSSRALERLRGMEVHINDLLDAWNEHYTSSFRLRRIECFREKSRAHHEYLIAEVVNDNDPIEDTNSLWLRIERRPKTIEGMLEYASGLMGGFEAHDLVTIARRREHLLHREDEGLEFRASMAFPRNISLKYILEVLKVVHQESPTYHIVGAHCWFFASVIVETLTSHGIWEQGRVHWHDHWKSKNYVNRSQYYAIVERLKALKTQ